MTDTTDEQSATPNRYMVFNVGCIECGVSSNIVGFYDDPAEAKSIADFLDEKLSWREGGQNSFEVFDTHAEQAPEYAVAFDDFPSTETAQ